MAVEKTKRSVPRLRVPHVHLAKSGHGPATVNGAATALLANKDNTSVALSIRNGKLQIAPLNVDILGVATLRRRPKNWRGKATAGSFINIPKKLFDLLGIKGGDDLIGRWDEKAGVMVFENISQSSETHDRDAQLPTDSHLLGTAGAAIDSSVGELP